MTESLEVETLRVQSLCGLAGVYCVQGRYGEAEPRFRQALTLAEAALGPDHLEVAKGGLRMQVKTRVKAGGRLANHTETLVRDTPRQRSRV